MTVGGAAVQAIPLFNTNHSAGFGVRLGFLADNGSFGAGMGMGLRDNGSFAIFSDLTGHGRPDVVLPGDLGIIIDYPNLGNGFGQARKYQLDGFTLNPVDDVGKQTGSHLSETTLVDAGVDFTLGFSTPWFKMVFNPDAKWSRSQTRELIGFVDVNGVGVPDVVTVTGAFLKDSGRRVQSGQSFPENKDLLQP